MVLPGYGSKPQTVMVSVTTRRDGVPHDAACELEAADHPFLQHGSYIAYRYARVDSTEHVEGMVKSGAWQPHAPCSQEVLQRIVDGMRATRLAPREIKGLF